ncbi:RNA dependent RNA polymerase [Plasmopara viticola lesion associated ourmia-like virus 57]|uniref:RNA dependent RNA polymerase n=1 Tax=Plasmopara viticola lesion associated ourmia-like virus 57 TaxID=2686528 RepID=A0ABX6FJ43_9VIRU|nr:RNA dependent RNA polymerase [Plasmopara viticola lesion associated ourmia-like virus 57]QGY72587.1 RNA dependent RNA polymerase [Plasmopara viticola lesion associated ourmia-like virus 57]
MRNSEATSSRPKPARCSAVGSLEKSLKKALHVIFSEFSIPGDVPVFKGVDCLSLRKEWDEFAKNVRTGHLKKVREVMLTSTLKSVKRMFDAECHVCDKKAGAAAKEKWMVSSETHSVMPQPTWCHDPLWLMKRRVRELVCGWGRRLESSRHGDGGDSLVYTPDQQGCLETRRHQGGTLATAPDDCSLESNQVRVGVAKTKGKHRVVTMQSARVKRVLSPVHNALYDHLTSFGWCVRGDVQKEDFLAVLADRREKESLISGDYASATDNLYTEAVLSVVEVLAEETALTEEERTVLVESFTDVYWESLSGRRHSIVRGSMMGNLVSFPLLCLVNKACFDITCDIYHGSGERRVGRFNGDDCAFAGDRGFFQLWREVTGTYGLVVNEEKTGFGSRWVELNSQPFHVKRKSLVPKPVISFLRCGREESEDLLAEVLRGIRSFKRSTRAWILNVAMRHEISLREIQVSNIPRKTLDFLLQKSWFRRALQLGPAPTKTTGVERKVEMIVANPPREEIYEFVTRKSRQLQRECVDRWLGVVLCPGPGVFKRTIDRRAFYKRTEHQKTIPPAYHLHKSERRWQFVWPLELFRWLEDRAPHLILDDEACKSDWITDHPFLQSSCRLSKGRETKWYEKFKNRCFVPAPLPDSINVRYAWGVCRQSMSY